MNTRQKTFRDNRTAGELLRHGGGLLVLIWLTSCSVAQVVVERVPETEPQPVPQAKVKPVPPKPQKKSAPSPTQQTSAPVSRAETGPQLQPVPASELQAVPVPVEALPGVAILVSKDVPAYTRVSGELTKRLKRVKTYDLNGDAAESNHVLHQIQQSGIRQVVAIGLLAARTARRLSGKQVIFCQVFNYKDYYLVTPWMKGVSMLPRFSEQFRVWKELDPGLRNVAVITGTNQENIVTVAKQAAQMYGIKLIHREVHSDKEMLYAFKRLTSEVQGLWLLPDNRVLSTGVVRAVMSHSVRRGKQVLVFNTALLKIGGLISIQGEERDVAAQVLARLQQAHGEPEIPGPDVTPLSGMQLQINARMVKRLGLVIPTKYAQLAYEP
ncbi:MAG: ABC transporter substrate-binding protein [Acidiferrobacterales bacterium]